MHKLIETDLEIIINSLGEEVLESLKGKRILISGGCGFLGSWFVALFEELNKISFPNDPIRVLAIDSLIATDGLNAITKINDANITFLKMDISQPFQDNPLFQKEISKGKIDFIIHAAGIASPIYYRKYPIETIEGMAFGLNNLLKFAVKNPVEGFLNFSSSEMYGNPAVDKVPTKESYNGNVSCTGPRSCYDESKRFGETLAMVYSQQHQIPITTVRPFNVFGPGMRISDDRVVPKFLCQMIKGEDVTVHVPGVQTRTFCYITDAMEGFMLALLKGKRGEAYNIGRETPEITMDYLAEMMKKQFPTESKIVAIEMPPEYPTDQAQRRCPDMTKAKNELGFYAVIALRTGLKRTHQWLKYLIDGGHL